MNDRYRRLYKLGEGTFGEVYRAFDTVEHRDVAIKVLKDTSPDGRARFKREALLLYQQLDNRFIIDLLDHGLDAETPYIVLEYCDQGSLRTLVGRLPWRAVASILVQVVQGLKKIHEIGGFHRDLKPENLLLKTEEPGTFVVKIADFGLARVPGIGSVMTHGPGGTRGYMAPEIERGERFIATADVYSLGVVVTELLTGSRDSKGLDKADLPPALRDIVLAMYAESPQRRPDMETIARVLHGLLVPASPPNASPTAVAASSTASALGGLLLTGALLAALAALASGEKQWDTNVRRYRGSDGRFKRG